MDFSQLVTEILDRYCVGMDDHGPGFGPDGRDYREPCRKCSEMRSQLVSAYEQCQVRPAVFA